MDSTQGFLLELLAGETPGMVTSGAEDEQGPGRVMKHYMECVSLLAVTQIRVTDGPGSFVVVIRTMTPNHRDMPGS